MIVCVCSSLGYHPAGGGEGLCVRRCGVRSGRELQGGLQHVSLCGQQPGHVHPHGMSARRVHHPALVTCPTCLSHPTYRTCDTPPTLGHTTCTWTYHLQLWHTTYSCDTPPTAVVHLHLDTPLTAVTHPLQHQWHTTYNTCDIPPATPYLYYLWHATYDTCDTLRTAPRLWHPSYNICDTPPTTPVTSGRHHPTCNTCDIPPTMPVALPTTPVTPGRHHPTCNTCYTLPATPVTSHVLYLWHTTYNTCDIRPASPHL